ncbi:MAG TPA: ABC transporter substrate-binding protein [Pseudogracilibacillus sp.]|nr:ABC transporter substrate-binding protein [Pseudogracilibacillus sp.]
MNRLTITSLLSLVLVLLFVACSPNETKQITLAEVTRSVFYTPQYVALEKGYFKEEGLEVDLQTSWGGDKTMTALLSDHADIALVGSETSVYVHAQNASDTIINFAQLTQTDGTFLVSKEAIDHFTWEDVRDEVFLGQRKGGMPQMVGEYVLKQNGIDPTKDLTELIQHIDFANIPAAFASGDAKFVQLFEPTASVFEQEGKGYVVASFGEESGLIPYTVFMTKASMIENDRETIEKFTRAIYKAQKWVEAANSEEIAEVVEPYFEDTTLEILTASIERYKAQESFALNPILTESAWDNLLNIMDEAGELPGESPYEELVNTDIAKDVMSQLD